MTETKKIRRVKPAPEVKDFVAVLCSDEYPGEIYVNCPRNFVLTKDQALELADSLVDTVEEMQ
jgi:hypothetical protein